MFKIAIFVSGRGSNMRALWEASQTADRPFEVIAVLSDNPDSPALKFAKEQNIPTHAAKTEGEWLKALEKYKPNLICLAGFMKILSAEFVQAWQGKIINIHPSLLPDYKGLNTHRRVLADGKKTHGATVHYVTEKLDDGAIIKQCHIEVLADDTADSLAARLLPQEHALYVEAVRQLAASHN